MKTEYTSQELRRLPGVTRDTLRTWAGRRNNTEGSKAATSVDDKKRKDSHQPVLLSPIKKPGKTHLWIYGGDAVERIWQIRMLKMIGCNNKEIEEFFSTPDSDKEIWKILDRKINNLRWKLQHLNAAKRFAETLRDTKKLPAFPRKENTDDIDRYLEVLPENPKASSMEYEEGSRIFLEAFEVDKDELIASSSSPEFLEVKDRIFHSIKKLWLLQTPADSNQVLSLVGTLYSFLSEKQGYNIKAFHSIGTVLSKQGDIGNTIDNAYGIGFSAFLAEAVFIYCFIQSNPQLFT